MRIVSGRTLRPSRSEKLAVPKPIHRMIDHQSSQFLIDQLVIRIGIEGGKLSMPPKGEIESTLLRQHLHLALQAHSEIQDLGALDVELAIEVNRDVEGVEA